MKTSFSSLDRHTTRTCEYSEPDRYRQIFTRPSDASMIARGSGLSYVAASFSERATSVGMKRFNRILAFDRDEGRIEVEAGVTLGQLYEFLTPLGLHLPVQPGHPQITIGGCIAGNVHGKNQFKEGVFKSLVREFRLFHPDHGVISASPGSNADIFDLTCGGLGLTGIIVSAQLSVAPLPGTAMRVDHLPVEDLDDAFRKVNSLASEYDMMYCWCDLSVLGRRAGSGYIVTGRFVSEDAAAHSGRPFKPLDPSSSAKFRPRLFANALIPWVNRAYRYRETRQSGPHTVPLFDFLFPAVGKEFYFDWFGNNGFVEHQVLIPTNAIEDYPSAVMKLLRHHGQPAALATVKAFRGNQHLLHYDGAGLNFTIDVINRAESRDLLKDMDDINSRFGAITNVMKDSRLSAAVAERQYSEYGEFRERLHSFDPKRRFTSCLSERLGL